MTAFLLTVGVITGTALWPIYRWAQKSGARFGQTFFMAGLTGFAVCLLATWTSGQNLLAARKSFAIGLVGGTLGVAVVFVTIRCLRMFSITSTTVVNNLGLFWPVMVDSLFLRPAGFSPIAIVGLAGMTATFVLLGCRPSEGASFSGKLASVPWLVLLWTLSGLCMAAQAVATFIEPGKASAYMCGNSLAMVVLLAVPWRWGDRNWRPCRDEIVIGVLWGLFYTLSPLMFLQTLVTLPATVVYPVAVAGPAVLIALIGPLVYREPMSRYGLAGVVLGIISLVAIAAG